MLTVSPHNRNILWMLAISNPHQRQTIKDIFFFNSCNFSVEINGQIDHTGHSFIEISVIIVCFFYVSFVSAWRTWIIMNMPTHHITRVLPSHLQLSSSHYVSPLPCSWEFKCSSISLWKNSSPSWPCEASLMALVCMHILYLSGGSSSAQVFSCHRWKRPRDGERITISLLWRYFLYRCTSSNPQPLMCRSKPPGRKFVVRIRRCI